MPSRNRELELKLEIPHDFEVVGPNFEAGGRKLLELTPLQQTSIYYDTSDLRLVRHGLTLRYRTENGGNGVWTLKLPSGDGLEREEVELEGGFGKVPQQARTLVTAFTRGAEIIPVAKLLTLRRRMALRDAAGVELAEISDDIVTSMEGGDAGARFRELEVEARNLDRQGLQTLRVQLQSAGAVFSNGTPKVARALGQRALEPPDVPLVEELSAKQPVSRIMTAALSTEVRRLMNHDPFARLGDVEGVHQMRVATRRLRSHLDMFGYAVHQDWAQALVTDVRWLGRALGAVRDADVLLARFRAVGGDLAEAAQPAIERLEPRRRDALDSLLARMAKPRYVELIEHLISAANNPATTDVASEPFGSAAPRMVNDAWRQLAAVARQLTPDSPIEDFHTARIAAKRARFAAEVTALATSKQTRRDANKFARYAERVQTALGDQRDSDAARKVLLESVGESPATEDLSAAQAKLLALLQQSAAENTKEFFRIWDKFDRKKHRAWLKN